jgi:ribosomal protein S18 acetylase RimI-like enzyme
VPDPHQHPDTGALYERGMATLLASWEAYARGAQRARLVRASGVAAAVFPAGPEREIYNNTLLARGLDAAGRAAARAAMEAAYAEAGVDRFAAWVHESDRNMIDELERHGYRLDETTRAMAMPLDDVATNTADEAIQGAAWTDHIAFLERFGTPAGLLAGGDGAGFSVVVAAVDGEHVATGLAFDHANDCGIYNVSTLDPYRRHGIATAVTRRLLADARRRGCATASLQASRAAEGLYLALGFRDLGRILEYVT